MITTILGIVLFVALAGLGVLMVILALVSIMVMSITTRQERD